MFRRVLLPVLLFALLILAVLFAAINPGAITVDLGLYEARVQKSMALTLAFIVGWVFGLLCLGLVILRLWLDARRLRKQLRLAEAEVHTLRSLPATHAD
jgi:lipopolysaccharide assembly protein A